MSYAPAYALKGKPACPESLDGYGRAYESWREMRQRCHNPNDRDYPGYGGRGITVCAGWGVRRGGFTNFLEDVGTPPPGCTIDRLDPDGHYSCGECGECEANGWPLGCRWSTPLEQARNRRNTKRLTLGDETRPLTEWAELLGINPATLDWRVRAGWSQEAALTTPVYSRANPNAGASGGAV